MIDEYMIKDREWKYKLLKNKRLKSHYCGESYHDDEDCYGHEYGHETL